MANRVKYKKAKVIALRIGSDVLDKLTIQAEKEGVSRNQLMIDILKKGCYE